MKIEKIIIASDSFKGSVSSHNVETYIENGIRRVSDDVEIEKVPIADGGDGTVDALVVGLQGEYIEKEVVGPYENKVTAKFGLIHDGKAAVIEMAEASGLHLVKGEMNPFSATTYGTGQLISAALDEGVEVIYVGLGGSATNDGGAGMAQALGASLLNEEGEEIGRGAQNLENLNRIDISGLDNRLREVDVVILSDVTNPLCGENGASYIYGPQKGAKEEDLPILDSLLAHYGEVIEESLGIQITEKEGAGAAGGLGAGLMVFCEAEMKRGIEEILELLQFDKRLETASLVITGEGKIDGQSLSGKAPIGVAKHAKNFQLPVIAVVGSADDDLSKVYENGIDLVIPITNKPMTLEEAIDHSEKLIANAGESAYRAFGLANKK